MAWMWLLMALAAGILFVHPYVTYPLSLVLMPCRPVRSGAGGCSGTLVFCAYNEMAVLPEKVANLRAIRLVAPALKFACYIDFGTDGSVEYLRREAGDLLSVIVASERTGKAVGMSRLAAAAKTEVMIFTDANVVLEPATVPRLLEYFNDPSIGGVCGTLNYVNAGETSTARTSSAYWSLEERIKKLETRSGSTMGADGSIFATRLTHYPCVPPHLLDDFITSMSVIFAGLRLISVPDVLAYERSASKSADEFRRKRRIACRAFSSHRHLWPQLRAMGALDRYKYVSHRLIRWHGAAFAALSALFGLMFLGALVGPLWSLAALLGAVALVVAGWRTGAPGLSHLYELLRALWATLLGVYDSWRGVTYQTWQPVQSR